MSTQPTDLDGYVASVLGELIGPERAAEVLADATTSLALATIESWEHVAQIGGFLAGQPNFVGLAGDLLVLKARDATAS
ncbi:MAG: hypothetical protein H0T89_23815 [Deltaproteobacteria bacterium]|nr:hypothetical protein [Deltaproteobacteria bacterium]MDQ3297378.1 hypothetical protein [Myxococcota bacterium]